MHAANVLREYIDVVHAEAVRAWNRIASWSATDACHDHISAAISRDEASGDQWREVMCLILFVTLQSFGEQFLRQFSESLALRHRE